MTDYTELVKALRYCAESGDFKCGKDCPMHKEYPHCLTKLDTAAAAAIAGIREAGAGVSASLAEELKAVRAELAEARSAYAESAKKYSALDAALSRVYALSGGDLGCALHDEQRFREEFKLNV